MSRREFHFSEGSSNKFWAIELAGKTHIVHFGRVGTTGQAQTKEFGSDDEAKKSSEKLIAEKVKKGYSEIKRRHEEHRHAGRDRCPKKGGKGRIVRREWGGEILRERESRGGRCGCPRDQDRCPANDCSQPTGLALGPVAKIKTHAAAHATFLQSSGCHQAVRPNSHGGLLELVGGRRRLASQPFA
jgi:predicted DNA-binding WGR domain protein